MGKRIKRVLLAVATAAAVYFPLATNGILPDISQSTGTELKNISQSFSVLESKGGTYFGPVTDLAYSGNGEFQHLEGGVYEGEFSASKREGVGVFTWPNGDSYSGEWQNDEMTSGTYTFADGRSFEGIFSDNSFWDGVFSYPNPTEATGLKSLSATIKSGKIEGATLATTNGASYSGSLTGQAEITYPTGNKYKGAVVDGVRSGEGTFSWIEGGAVVASYVGSWENGLMSGSGKYYYTGAEYPYISGSFINGLLNGHATYYKEAGNAFATEWDNGACISVTEA